jgi:hypothetical protein
MPIAYAERKKRRQALLQGLVPELRQRLALRHVEAVIKLPPQAQRTLAEALSVGLHNIPEAIATLQEHQQASAEEVLRARKDGRQKESPTSCQSSPVNTPPIRGNTAPVIRGNDAPPTERMLIGKVLVWGVMLKNSLVHLHLLQ